MIILMTTGNLPLPRKLTLTTERALQSDLSTLKLFTVTVQRSHCHHGSQLITSKINCHSIRGYGSFTGSECLH